MTQPTTSPRFATDATYTAGPDTGLANKVAPSAGLVAQGFRRDRRLPAARLNSILANHGEFLESSADAPALDWSIAARISGELVGEFDLGLARSRITLLRNVNALGYDGQDLLLAFGSVNMYRSRDGHSFLNRGPHGLNASTGTGFAAGLMADDATYAIVGWNEAASGAIRKTLDLGVTWAGAGTLPASFNTGGVSIGGVHPVSGRFFICGGTSQLYYSDTLAAAEWTLMAGAATDFFPECVASSPTELAFGGSAGGGGGGRVMWSADGATWAQSSLAGITDVVGLHWSTSHQLWVALRGSREVYTAPAGFASWTLRSTPDFGSVQTGGNPVSSIGRTIVAAIGDGLFVSRDITNWERLPVLLTDDGINPDAWVFLHQFGGRVYAYRAYDSSGVETVEYVRSGALPALFSEGRAW